MKVKFKSTGRIVDFEADDWLFAMIETGLIEQVTVQGTKKARHVVWEVAEHVSAGHRWPFVIGHCTACNTKDFFETSDRNGPRSIKGKAFRCPCSKLSVEIPQEILAQVGE
jgi:hypothetical protein